MQKATQKTNQKSTILFLALIFMCLSILTGCNLITLDNDKNMRQVVVVIHPAKQTLTILEPVLDQNGNPTFDGNNDPIETSVVLEFAPSEPIKIYKAELINYINNNMETISQSASNAEDAVKQAVRDLVQRELAFLEIEKLIAFEKIDFNQDIKDDDGNVIGGMNYKNINDVKKLVYQSIDAEIFRLGNVILTERGEDARPEQEDVAAPAPTYNVQESEEPEIVAESTQWFPSVAQWPGMGHDSTPNKDMQSLGRASLSRFIEQLRKNVNDDYRATASDKKRFNADFNKIDQIIKTQGISAVYPELFKWVDGTNGNDGYFDFYPVYWLAGKSAERQIKLNLLEKYLYDSIEVTNESINRYYTDELETQKNAFDANEAAYHEAASSEETDLVLYTPHGRYFYVKHILLQFNAEQKALLQTAKNTSTSTEQYELERARIAQMIRVNPRVNGEADTSVTLTGQQVYNEVKAAMAPLSGRGLIFESHARFTELIYRFNDDPGAFRYKRGYLVRPVPEKGVKEDYQQEFADEARRMKEEEVLGSIGNMIITDEGYHILYYYMDTTQGMELSLDDYTTFARTQTVREYITDKIKESRKTAVFSEWRDSALTYYEDIHKGSVRRYENNYRDLWEKR